MRKKIYLLFVLCNLIIANCYSQSSSSCDSPPGPPDGPQKDGGGDGGSGGTSIEGIGSWDPNLIVTSPGVGNPRWVSVNDKIGATIYFENDPNLATAPVHNAYIYYAFSPKQDPLSFRLGSYGFNGMVFTVPQNLNFYQTRLDLKDTLGLYVDVTAGINVTNNTAFWIFQSIDPETNLPPVDPLKGFLPIKDSLAGSLGDTLSQAGEGFVNFTTTPYSTDKTRDSIYAQAKIVFDINDTIPTNVTFNTVDAKPPTSSIYMSTVSNNTISLFWNGADDKNGSGVKDYSVYVSENDSPFVFYKTVSGLTTDYTGNPGNIYCFFVMARDSVNNMETPLKNTCEVRDTLSGSVLPVTWLYFRGQQQANNVLLNWATGSEINTDYFAVERSFNGHDFEDIGKINAAGNSGVSHTYQYLDINAMKLKSNIIYYRLRQVDNDGKYVHSDIISFVIRNNEQEYVKVYPNPFSQQITIITKTIQAAETSDRLELYSINGVLLYRRTLSDRLNNMPIVLNDLPALANGTYLLKTYLNGKTNTVKIVKQ